MGLSGRNPRSCFSFLAQRFLDFEARDFLEAALLTGAVLRLYVLVGFLARAGAPNDVEEGAAYVTGAWAGWTVSYIAGAGDGAGSAVKGASTAGTSCACSVVVGA
jgi:hypothetical protein